MIDFLEVCRRALSGPLMPEKKFDLEQFYPALTQIVKKYGIQYDKENPVNQDDALADAIYEAAVDLLAEVGVYCLDTQRVIQFNREEVEEAIHQAPGPCWFGEGHERRLFKPRKPDDLTPSWCHVGSGVATSSEEIAFRTVEGYARISEADSVAVPSILYLRQTPVTSGSPVELLGAIQANTLARQALQQGGRPGLPILNFNSTAASAIGTIAASRPDFGARASDGWIVGFIAELKVDFGALNKIAYLTSWNASVGSQGAPILGGILWRPGGNRYNQCSLYHCRHFAHEGFISIDIPYGHKPVLLDITESLVGGGCQQPGYQPKYLLSHYQPGLYSWRTDDRELFLRSNRLSPDSNLFRLISSDTYTGQGTEG